MIRRMIDNATSPYYTAIEGSAWAWFGYAAHYHGWLRWMGVPAVLAAPFVGWAVRKMSGIKPTVKRRPA